MSEPNVLTEHTECRECDGTGTEEYEYGFSGDTEPRTAIGDCGACKSLCFVRLADLEEAKQ